MSPSHRKNGLHGKLVGDFPADIGEYKSAGALAWMPAVRGMIEFELINPCRRHGKTTEVEMVFNGKRFAALGVDGSDVLLYFLESALSIFQRSVQECRQHKKR